MLKPWSTIETIKLSKIQKLAEEAGFEADTRIMHTLFKVVTLGLYFNLNILYNSIRSRFDARLVRWSIEKLIIE